MLIQPAHPAPSRFARGVSMIEILVTLTIVAFGVLGLLGLQARTLSHQKDSADRKAAAEMVEQLAERMRANHLGFTSGEYDLDLKNTDATPGSIATCATKTACTLEEVAARDLDQWVIELRRRIPGSAAYLVWERRYRTAFGVPGGPTTDQGRWRGPLCVAIQPCQPITAATKRGASCPYSNVTGPCAFAARRTPIELVMRWRSAGNHRRRGVVFLVGKVSLLASGGLGREAGRIAMFFIGDSVKLAGMAKSSGPTGRHPRQCSMERIPRLREPFKSVRVPPDLSATAARRCRPTCCMRVSARPEIASVSAAERANLTMPDCAGDSNTTQDETIALTAQHPKAGVQRRMVTSVFGLNAAGTSLNCTGNGGGGNQPLVGNVIRFKVFYRFDDVALPLPSQVSPMPPTGRIRTRCGVPERACEHGDQCRTT
jgi:type IV pilus modification protein PilV